MFKRASLVLVAALLLSMLAGCVQPAATVPEGDGDGGALSVFGAYATAIEEPWDGVIHTALKKAEEEGDAPAEPEAAKAEPKKTPARRTAAKKPKATKVEETEAEGDAPVEEAATTKAKSAPKTAKGNGADANEEPPEAKAEPAVAAIEPEPEVSNKPTRKGWWSLGR